MPATVTPKAKATERPPWSGLEHTTTTARYLRAVNYLAAAQIYLAFNPLLRDPLRPDHVKDRLLGHWGTCPGINLVHTYLNQFILRADASVLLVTGPGHGAAANLANMYLDGSLAEVYPDMTRDLVGLTAFVRAFSWPGGFASHLTPALPGVIHEGGELGYALATAFGAAFDNPDLLVPCIVGDGEAETGPTATAWHSTKFLNPATDGAVLPILHLNGYKIASPSLYGTMDRDDLDSLFTGYGYAPYFAGYDGRPEDEFAAAMEEAYADVRWIQSQARQGQSLRKPRWPMIVLHTPKGWTGPKEVDGKPVEGTFRAHQVPGKGLKTNPVHLAAVEGWLKSYRPEELFDAAGRPAPDLLAACPRGDRRIALNPHALGGAVRRPLTLPSVEDAGVEIVERGGQSASSMEALGRYLRLVTALNQKDRNFRVVCPDELESNKLGAILDVTDRQYTWPVPPEVEHIGPDGRVMEVLSEHTCQGWLQGYLLTGRHGVFPCYEAFVGIVDTMMNQYAKFLKTSMELPWRRQVAALNYVLSSDAWRQEHNGYSHQGPGFINNLLTKKGHTIRVYLPPDANSLLVTMEHCLTSTNRVNLVVAGKQPMPQWLTLAEAREHCRVGASVWRWASSHDGEQSDIVLAGCGDTPTLEVMAAAQLLRDLAPDWRVRVVNVTNLLALGIPQKYPHGLDADHFDDLFPPGVPVVFNFHGYTAAVKQLLFERPNNGRFDLNGYREEGTTTTPFDMHVRNRTSRYHLVMQVAEKVAARRPDTQSRAEVLTRTCWDHLSDHDKYIRQHGVDRPEVVGWRWQPQ
ncbi:phosphoketolase family protein [Limnoglobus roseus]|uniref:Phosphoketolase n=1 Tax=Limnoglobus roseus TaxID=2598579 RepID=A0A5C1AFI5_9BACT|nr:phosphoketolase family protein [Limnoglobus roseus]QEL16736.1 phosphoketolase [Limnoglobus roseus]